MSVIYKITNKINNKSYIGMTSQKDYMSYINDHFASALNNKSNRYFYNAIKKYGKKNFIIEIIQNINCNRKVLQEMEKWYISYYNTYNGRGYNTTGGDGNFNPSKEIRDKISKTMIKRGTSAGQNNAFSKTKMSKKKRIIMKEKTLKTMLTPDENGETIYYKAGKKQSETRKKQGTSKGCKNPSARKYILISPKGKKIYSFGVLRKICNKYNLKFSKVFSCVNNGKINYKINKKFLSPESINTIGWEIKTI